MPWTSKVWFHTSTQSPLIEEKSYKNTSGGGILLLVIPKLIKLEYWTLERKFFLGHFSYDLSSWITFIELSPQIYSITFLLQHFFYGNLQVPSNFLSVILQAMLILHKLHFLIAVLYVSASSRTAWLWARFQ